MTTRAGEVDPVHGETPTEPQVPTTKTRCVSRHNSQDRGEVWEALQEEAEGWGRAEPLLVATAASTLSSVLRHSSGSLPTPSCKEHTPGQRLARTVEQGEWQRPIAPQA